MFVRAFAAVILLLAPIAASAQQPATPRDQLVPSAVEGPTVVTAGEGVVQAAPDRAWISVTAESRAASPREAQRKNAEAMKPVQDRLRAAGIPDNAIKTLAYDLLAFDRILKIEEQGVSSPPIPIPRTFEAKAADAPPIAAGELEVRARVTVTSLLK
jgi:uncharacterized protein YggE